MALWDQNNNLNDIIMNKLVSVIIITHNRPNLFKRLNSVLQQTINYEIIVIINYILDVETIKNKNIKYYKSKPMYN